MQKKVCKSAKIVLLCHSFTNIPCENLCALSQSLTYEISPSYHDAQTETDSISLRSGLIIK